MLYISHSDAMLIVFCEHSFIDHVDRMWKRRANVHTHSTHYDGCVCVCDEKKPIRLMEKSKGVTSILTKLCAIRNGSSHFFTLDTRHSQSRHVHSSIFGMLFAFYGSVFAFTNDQIRFIPQITISFSVSKESKHQWHLTAITMVNGGDFSIKSNTQSSVVIQELIVFFFAFSRPFNRGIVFLLRQKPQCAQASVYEFRLGRFLVYFAVKTMACCHWLSKIFQFSTSTMRRIWCHLLEVFYPLNWNIHARKGHVFPYWWRNRARHQSFRSTWKRRT